MISAKIGLPQQQNGQKAFKCSSCDKRYFTASDLQKHNDNAHKKLKKYECDEFHKKFFRKQDMEARRYTHTGEKPLACDLCDFRCIQSGDMSKHKKKHIGVANERIKSLHAF